MGRAVAATYVVLSYRWIGLCAVLSGRVHLSRLPRVVCIALVSAAFFAAGCADAGDRPGMDGGADMELMRDAQVGEMEAGADGGPLDASMFDATLFDASTPLPDASGEDASLDAGIDPSMDAGFSMDASADAGMVVSIDAGVYAPIDLGVDAPIDLGFDASRDLGFDASTDLGFDASIDLGFDASIDLGSDASRDAGVDAPPDAGLPDAGPAGPALLGSLAGLPAIKSISSTADGSRIVIGMPDHTYRTRNYAGSARVYRRDLGVWVLEQELGLGFADFETFGSSVAISGDGTRLAVARAPTGTTRYVHLYQRSGTMWTQTQVLSDGDAFDGYATALAISFDGYTLAVPRRGTAPTGQVLVYRGDATRLMTLRATLVPATSVATSFYQFGGSVSMSGDATVIAVGAPMESSAATGVGGDATSDTATSAGAAYVFHTTAPDVWTQAAYLKASNTGAYDQFGTAIAVSRDGNTVAVGAMGEDSAATGIDGDGTSNATDAAGAVYVFARSAGVWRHVAYVKDSDTNTNGSFGRVVTLSGDGTLLGVVGRNAIGGAGYVFSLSAAWSQRYFIDAPLGTNAADIGSDGTVFALGVAGAPGRDSGGQFSVYALP